MKKGFVLSLIVMVIVLYACSGGGSGGGTGGGNIQGIHLTGKLSGMSGSSSQHLSKSMAQAIPSHVWAIPIAKIQGANIDPINVYLRQSSILSSDGNFSFDLPQSITVQELKSKLPDIKLPPDIPPDYTFELDWLIVSVDTSTKPVTVLDMIQLTGNSGYDSLMLLPISSFTVNSFDLGVITDGDSEKTTDTIETVSTIKGESLKILSRADNIMRSLKNIIQNCDIEHNKCISATQSFAFSGDYANIGTRFDIAESYSGYQFYLDLNDYYGPSDFDGICPGGSSSPSVIYTLTPPANITINSTTYGPANPMTTGSSPGLQEPRGTNEMVCSQGKDNVFLWKRKDNSGQWKEWGLQFITGDSPQELTTQMPQGQWSLKRNGNEIAKFEFILANPVDTNGKPLVFVPAIRLRNNGNDVIPGDPITHVEVKWYRWDDTTGDYVEITGDDLTMLDDLAGNFGVSFMDIDGITGDTTQRSVHWWDLSFKNNTSIDVSSPEDDKGPFYYNHDDNTKYLALYIGIYYQFGGQGFRFVWRMGP